MLPSCRLGLLLLHERYKTGSKWQPYVENLPARVKGVPLSSFGIADMRALQDDKLTEKIDERFVFDYDVGIVRGYFIEETTLSSWLDLYVLLTKLGNR